MIRVFARAAALVVLSGGCALLGKNDPLEPRYLSPESIHEAEPAVRPGPAGAASAPAPALHMGRVASGSYLKERVVFRDADHEIGFYEDLRWTERPEVYLLRALERALFDGGAVTRSLQSSSPTLSAELVDFEEVRHPNPGVRLSVTYALHDDRTVLRGRTVTVERPLADGDAASQPRRVAAAMGEALRAAVGEIRAEVVSGLLAPPPPPVPK